MLLIKVLSDTRIFVKGKTIKFYTTKTKNKQEKCAQEETTWKEERSMIMHNRIVSDAAPVHNAQMQYTTPRVKGFPNILRSPIIEMNWIFSLEQITNVEKK